MSYGPENKCGRAFDDWDSNLKVGHGKGFFGPASVWARSDMAAGLLLCMAWYYTILSGFYILYCPVMYLMFFNHRLYRKIVDTLFALWELYPVALFQCCGSAEIHHFGDYVNKDEKTLIVMNHRTRVDWNYVWIALYHAKQDPPADKCVCRENIMDFQEINGSKQILDIGGTSKTKFVLKDEIKNVPGIGWIMQMNFFLYVKRNWQEDQANLSRFIDYYTRLDYIYRVLLFPEGTDLSEDNLRRSDKFATTNNLPKYRFVLHPRTTGWAALCSRLRQSGLASIYDLTIAYDHPAQTEMDLLRGNIPTNIYVYFKRYPINLLPTNEAGLRTWLNDRWRDKENNLRKFHNAGYFFDPVAKRPPPHRTPRSLLVAKTAFIFWTIIDIIFAYAILNNSVFQFWVIYHTLVFIFITWYFGGFHNIQHKLLFNK